MEEYSDVYSDLDLYHIDLDMGDLWSLDLDNSGSSVTPVNSFVDQPNPYSIITNDQQILQPPHPQSHKVFISPDYISSAIEFLRTNKSIKFLSRENFSVEKDGRINLKECGREICSQLFFWLRAPKRIRQRTYICIDDVIESANRLLASHYSDDEIEYLNHYFHNMPILPPLTAIVELEKSFRLYQSDVSCLSRHPSLPVADSESRKRKNGNPLDISILADKTAELLELYREFLKTTSGPEVIPTCLTHRLLLFLSLYQTFEILSV